MVKTSHYLSKRSKEKRVHTRGSLAFTTIIIALVIILLGITTYTYKDAILSKLNRPKTVSKLEIPERITPRPIKRIPSGSQNFSFSHGDTVVGPKIGKATINPLNPKQGDKQTLTVTIRHDSPVTSASIMLITDNAKAPYTLTLKDGTNTNGTWVGSWTIADSYDYTYAFDFTLKSKTGDYRGAITIRNDDGKL